MLGQCHNLKQCCKAVLRKKSSLQIIPCLLFIGLTLVVRPEFLFFFSKPDILKGIFLYGLLGGHKMKISAVLPF